MNNNIRLIEEFECFLDDLKLSIKVGKKYDEGTKQELYYAKSSYKNIFSISESREKAIEYCIKKVKFKRAVLRGNVKLIKEEEGIEIAKRAFKNHFINRVDINNIMPNLCFDFETDDELLIINITYSKEANIEKRSNNFPTVFAMIFVNLITGSCELLENKMTNTD